MIERVVFYLQAHLNTDLNVKANERERFSFPIQRGSGRCIKLIDGRTSMTYVYLR